MWLWPLLLVAPCVFIIGTPLFFIAYIWTSEEIDYRSGRAGPHYIGFDTHVFTNTGWIFLASIFLLFVAGVVLMIRNSLADRNRE